MATLSLWLILLFQNSIRTNVHAYYLEWELTVPYGNQQYASNFSHFTTQFCRDTFQKLSRCCFLHADFSPFCLGFCSLFYNYPSQTLLQRFRTMFSGYFTNYPIFHHIRKSPGGSMEGYHTPHLFHSLKVQCTLGRGGRSTVQ